MGLEYQHFTSMVSNRSIYSTAQAPARADGTPVCRYYFRLNGQLGSSTRADVVQE